MSERERIAEALTLLAGVDQVEESLRGWRAGRQVVAPAIDRAITALTAAGQAAALLRPEPVWEPETWRKLVENLWDILDEIDTASDMAKGDDAFYRKRVKVLQSRRWRTGITTDGYKLAMPWEPSLSDERPKDSPPAAPEEHDHE